MSEGQKAPKPQGPIAVFDSGLGGISVLRELLKVMPDENYIFYGDSRNAPYGLHTTQEVHDLTMENADFLVRKGAKALVIACNTATSAAINDLRDLYTEIPVIGIEPAVKPAALNHPGGRILVMATPITLNEEKFRKLVAQYETQAQIIPCPCAELVEFVERGELDSPELLKYLTGQLKPFLGEELKAVVLGCTHYSFARKAIQQVCGPDVAIYDGAEGTARHTRHRLEEMGLLFENEEPEVEIMNSSGDYEMIMRGYDYLDMD